MPMFMKISLLLLIITLALSPIKSAAAIENIKSITIVEHNNHAQLSWSVEHNELIDHFEIERKDAEGVFKVIAFVMSDDVNGEQSYTYKEKLTGSENTLQIRVKAIAVDGTISCSSIAHLRLTQIADEEIKFKPNPVRQSAELNLPLIKGSYLCRVYNMFGRLLLVTAVQGKKAVLQVEQLKPGSYFVEAFHPQTAKRYYGSMTKQ